MLIEDYIEHRTNGEGVDLIQKNYQLSHDMLWTLELSYQCHKREMSLEEAVLLIQNPKLVIVNGKPFNSFKSACDFHKVDSAYLYKKEKVTGIPKEALLSEKINSGIRQLPVEYKGKTYSSFSELCRSFDLDPIKVQGLIDNRNITREEAFTLSLKYREGVPVNRKGIAVTVNGKEFVSKSEAMRTYNVSPVKVYKLELAGNTFEEAINKAKTNGVQNS